MVLRVDDHHGKDWWEWPEDKHDLLQTTHVKTLSWADRCVACTQQGYSHVILFSACSLSRSINSTSMFFFPLINIYVHSLLTWVTNLVLSFGSLVHNCECWLISSYVPVSVSSHHVSWFWLVLMMMVMMLGWQTLPVNHILIPNICVLLYQCSCLGLLKVLLLFV